MLHHMTEHADTGFVSLGLHPQWQQALPWATPTAVQRAVLPAALAGRDVLALAPTGSGKTAAFVLPLLQRLQAAPLHTQPRELLAVVLAPTRELAAQSFDVITALAMPVLPELKTLLLVGGVSINPQLMALRGGAHVLVATPGRLLDVYRHNAAPLHRVRLVVLDEADRLLDAGFAGEVQTLLRLMPLRRQNMLVSATFADAVQSLAAQMLHDPVLVDTRVDGNEVPAGQPPASLPAGELKLTSESLTPTSPPIHQRALQVSRSQRTPLLRHLLATQGWRNTLVFVATQHASEQLANKLRQGGVAAAALHGQLSTGRRAAALADFHQGLVQVLVATDVAARGLDFDALAAVVNHDLPRAAADYTHRIGRTGRMGRMGRKAHSGQAVSFICADEPGSEAHFRLIEKRQGQRVPREQVAGFEPAVVLLPSVVSDSAGGVKGKRPSKKDKLRAAAAAAAAASDQPLT
jgi:ATP-dependent RNA helicase RhlE